MADTRDLKSLGRKAVWVRFPPRALVEHNMQQNLTDAMTLFERKPVAYVLSSDGTYLYKGSCRDLLARMEDHLAGRVSKTKNLRPLSLGYCKYFNCYSDARKHELYLKTGHGRAWLKRNIGGGI